jgi:hypothetical protein
MMTSNLDPDSAVHLPESTGRSQGSSKSPSSCLRRQVGSQRWNGLVIATGVISKLDCYGLSGSLWDGAIQFLDSSVSLFMLIKPDETNTLWEPFKKQKKGKEKKLKLRKQQNNEAKLFRIRTDDRTKAGAFYNTT